MTGHDVTEKLHTTCAKIAEIEDVLDRKLVKDESVGKSHNGLSRSEWGGHTFKYKAGVVYTYDAEGGSELIWACP